MYGHCTKYLNVPLYWESLNSPISDHIHHFIPQCIFITIVSDLPNKSFMFCLFLYFCCSNIDNRVSWKQSFVTRVSLCMYSRLFSSVLPVPRMQVPEGGLRDKPGKPKDYYHTCYCLSGLSLCQYSLSKEDSPPLPKAVVGPYFNLLEPVHPLYNVVFERSIEALDFFRGK